MPVGARDTCERLGRMADEVVCVSMPVPLNAVGLWYEEFSQNTDDEVKLWHRAGGHPLPVLVAEISENTARPAGKPAAGT